MDIVNVFIVIVGAYLLGSIPTAVWVSKFACGIDVRTQGSGNAGFTNTIRLCGFKKAIPVFFIDMLKGVFAILLAKYFFPETEIMHIITAIVAIIGHLFPIFARFKGGKGVLTSLGIIVGMYPLIALLVFIIFLLVFLKSKIVSLSSLIASFFLSVFVIIDWKFFGYYTKSLEYLLFALFITVMVFYTHRKNISRLLKGEESSFKKKDKK